MRVRIRRRPGNDDLPLPAPATAGSAGHDLRAAVAGEVRLRPGERALVPTGFEIALPPGWEAQVRPRSGLALQRGLTLLNAPGTVDSDYRGEIALVVINLGAEDAVIRRGERIGQIVVQRVAAIEWMPVEDLPASERGSGGFGHSGSR